MSLKKISRKDARLSLSCCKAVIGSSKEDVRSIKEELIDFISHLPEVYGEDLERVKMWERITNGLISSSSKSGGNVDIFVNSILSFIKADGGKVASNNSIKNMAVASSIRPKEWGKEVCRIASVETYLIVVMAREKYMSRKGDN
jgi:hypothetical protein